LPALPQSGYRLTQDVDCDSVPYWKVDMRSTMSRNGKIDRFVGLNGVVVFVVTYALSAWSEHR
jgi:hypothetical protein